MMQRDFKPTFQLILRSIFAGICIGIAGWGFLANKTIGMFLFIFGLATVVSYQAKLFTGMAGYVGSKQDLLELILPRKARSLAIGYRCYLRFRCSSIAASHTVLRTPSTTSRLLILS